MSSAEDRQARALEEIARSFKQLHNVVSALNTNFVAAFDFIKDQVEKAEEFDRQLAQQDPNQMSIDDLRAKAEAEQRERDARAAFEEWQRHVYPPPRVDEKLMTEHGLEDANKFERLPNEFDKPEHRPKSFQDYEGSE